MGVQMKEIASWFSMLGVPTIFVLVSWCVRACYSFYKKLDVLASAQKAQMRGQLLEAFYTYKERGFVYADQLDEWINQYESYHLLVGNNGVLDSRKNEILQLQVRTR